MATQEEGAFKPPLLLVTGATPLRPAPYYEACNVTNMFTLQFQGYLVRYLDEILDDLKRRLANVCYQV